MIKLFLLFSLLIPSLVFSYTINRGNYGEELYWPNPNQILYLNTANSSLISSSNLSTILNSSKNEFSSYGASLSSIVTTGNAANGRNDVYFTSSSSVFTGSSILGVTKVSFEQSSGVIIEADILINDSVFFTSIAGSGNYIGDVLTHELGHFLGLGHSQVHGSTMFYSLSNGQYTLDHDDISGVEHLYSSSSSEITGTVVGGSGIGVFGAHVQAISASTGKV